MGEKVDMKSVNIYFRTRLVTCSADSCIKLWSSPQKFDFKRKDNKSTSSVSDFRKLTGNTKKDPVCIGEMWAHTDSVNQVLQFTENSFASCSNDGTVILWKVFENCFRVTDVAGWLGRVPIT